MTQVGGTLYCNPPASRGRQTQALLLGASIKPTFIIHRSQWVEGERLCTNGFEVMTLYLLHFVFSVLQHTLIVATQPIVFFGVPSPNRDLLDILVDLFFPYAHMFILCSAQPYAVWQIHRVIFPPPQYHIEHPITLRNARYSPFVECLFLSPHPLATTNLFSDSIDVPFQ